MTEGRRSRLPLAGRLIVRLRRLGGRRPEVEDDLRDLFDVRVRTRGRRYAAFRYTLDALSLWRWRIGAFASPDVTAPETRPRQRLGGLTQDITFAIRMFARHPGIVAMTVAGLSLAIGISTVILTLVNAVTMRSTGIREPASVHSIEVFNLTRGRLVGGYSPMYGNWASIDVDRLVDGVPSMELAADSPYTIPTDFRRTADRSSTESILLMPVSGDYFGVLGARAAIGRTIVRDDDMVTADRVAFMSHTLWKVRCDADPGIVGKTVWLDDVPFTVVGVAERGFVGAHGSKFQTAPALWVSFASQAAVWSESQRVANARAAADVARLASQPSLDAIGRMRLGALRASLASVPDRWNIPVDLVGRLRPGMSAVQAETELANMARALAAEGRSAGEQRPTVQLGPVERPRTEPAMTAIIAVIVVVLLALACSNVANLLLANAAGRRREIGTRFALGAGRARIVRQLLTESVVLGACAGIAGLLLSRWLTPLAALLLRLPELVDLEPDLRVYALTAIITLAAGVIAGLAPARYGLRGSFLSALQSDRAGSSGTLAPTRLRSVLVGSQATACVVLLVVAALLTRSAAEAAGFNTGVAIDRLVNVSPNLGRGYDPVRKRVYLEAALQRLEQLPGVVSAALAAVPPFHTFHATMPLTGSPVNPGPPRVQRNEVSGNYFDTVGIRVLQGRTFSEDEARDQLPVAMISASLARQFWGDASPIGAMLDRVWGAPDTPDDSTGNLMRKPAGTRVIGVVTDSMTQIDDYDLPTIYLPLDTANIVAHIVVSADGEPKALSATIRPEVLALDPDLSPFVALPSERLRDNLQASRAMAGATSVIGASALALAVIGLFGVTAFVVGQRRREISIRMALGATGRDVVRMLVRDSLRPVAVGLGCGLVAAFICGQLMKNILVGISGHDPIAILSAAAVLIGTAALAAFVPARRAAGIDPAITLKQE